MEGVAEERALYFRVTKASSHPSLATGAGDAPLSGMLSPHSCGEDNTHPAAVSPVRVALWK